MAFSHGLAYDIVVGTNEIKGILYEYGTNISWSAKIGDWHTNVYVRPLCYTGDEVWCDMSTEMVITNGTDSYAVDWSLPRYIKGHAKTLNVPSWTCCSGDLYYNDVLEKEIFDYCDTDALAGITNVDTIVIRNSDVYIEIDQYNYNFLTASTFKTIVVSGDAPMVGVDWWNPLVSEVSLNVVQEILFHTKELFYPAQYSNSWESAIRKLSFDGKFGAYSGETFSRENIVPDSGNLKPVEPPVVTNYVYSTVTNYVFSLVTNEVFHYSTVTNEIFHYTTVTNVVKYVPEPGTSPDAGYGINVGAGGETVIAGAAGWDAFGVPDGMAWNKETGTLSGRAKLSGAYDLILVSGSGADTKIMRTTLTVAPYDTIVGYVGVAFSQGGAPLDNLKSYKTLPAGLKWKNGKLSGVPTKKQTVKLATKDGEPVTIEIRALPTAAVGSFSGAVVTGAGGAAATPVGSVTLSVTAAGKVSGKIYEGGRAWTLSAANFSSASVPTNGEFRVSGTATRTVSKKTYKQQWSLVIAVDGGLGVAVLPGATIATGTFGDAMTFEAQRNFWKDAGAGELIADWVGEYAWTAPDGGKLTLALDAAGAVKVTGKLGNGRALSLSTPLAYRDGACEALIYAAPATVKEKKATKKYPEFIAVVKLVNEPGMSEAGGDIAYRYR